MALTSLYRISAFEMILSAVLKKETVIIMPRADEELYLETIANYKVGFQLCNK